MRNYNMTGESDPLTSWASQRALHTMKQGPCSTSLQTEWENILAASCDR